MSLVVWIHWLAAFIVLAEALNKMERSHPLARGLSTHERIIEVLKAVAWFLLGFGSGIAMAGPLLRALGLCETGLMSWVRLDVPSAGDAIVMLGFAVLIVRTRVKEG